MIIMTKKMEVLIATKNEAKIKKYSTILNELNIKTTILRNSVIKTIIK